MKPREYQAKALNQLREARDQGGKSGLLVMATGTGKTITAGFDTKYANAERVLFLAHQREIIKQAREEFQKVHGEIDGSLYYGKEKDSSADFLFATIQTLYQDRHLEKFDKDASDYIVVDEFHHAQAPTYRKVLNYFKPDFLLGLTATPFLIDVDEQDLLDLVELEEPTYRLKTDEATYKGILSKFEAYIHKDNINYRDAPGNLSEKDLSKKLFLPERNKYIVEKWEEDASGRKTIVFCRTIEHAKGTATHFQEANVAAETIHSQIPDTKRDKRVQWFRDGHLDVLTTVDVFNEGVDFPEVECLLFMRPTMSKRIFHQQLGRGLRKVPGKDKCLVLDFVNETDWDRLNWYGSTGVGNYLSGECERCRKESRRLLEIDHENICKECRTEPAQIRTGMGTVRIDVEAIFDIATAYQEYRFNWHGISEEALIEDLRSVADDIGSTPSRKEYEQTGRFSATPIRSTFGPWKKGSLLQDYLLSNRLRKFQIRR